MIELNLVTISIIGLIVGVVSNLLPLLGNSVINFSLAIVLIGIHQGLQAMGLNGFSAPLIVFIQWYFVGTFGIKLLSLLPIPILQPLAQLFRGN